MDKTTHLSGSWAIIARSEWLYISPVVSYVLIDREGVEVHFNMLKKERGQFPAVLTEQVLPINDLLHGKRTLLSCGTQRVLPRGQESAVLPSAGFGSP